MTALAMIATSWLTAGSIFAACHGIGNHPPGGRNQFAARLDSPVYPPYAMDIEQATTGGNEMNTITAKQIKLTNAMPGYYVHNNYKAGHTFDITKNNLGMWTVNHEDWNTDTKETITAETLNDARAFIASRY